MPEIQRLPIETSEANYSFRTTLEERDYVLDLRWNTRGQTWFLDIRDAQEQDLILGLALVPNFDVLYQYAIEGMPPGQIILFDATGVQDPPGFDDLGARHVLTYVTSE